MSTYQILAGADREFEVIEYPTHAQERAFNKLLVRSADHIVAKGEKERLCNKWGWDLEEAITNEVTTREEYHLALAKVIFQDADDLSDAHVDQMRPGLVQEARMDFIEGCEGRSDERADFSRLLQAMMASRSDQNGKTTGTGTKAGTAAR